MRAKQKPAITPKIELQAANVDNPYYSREHDGAKGNLPKIVAMVNIRESAVSVLAARGYLNKSQVRSADRFRALWESMGGSGAGAFDYSRDPVDGGGARDPISDRMIDAGKELDQCRQLLGLRGFTLVRQVCGEGHSLWDIGSKRRDRDSAADALRGYLDDLSVMWGYSTSR